MRSNEFIKEAGRNGSMDDFGQPINPIPTDAEYAARQAAGQKNFDTLKGVGSKIANAFKGTGTQSATPADDTTEAGYLVDRNGNPVTDGSGQPIRTPNSRIPKAAAMPAYQARDLPDPRSFDRTEPAYADRFKPGQSATPGFVMPPPGVIFNDPDAEARAAAAAERNRKAITSTERPAPAPVKPAAVVPAPPAPVKPAAVVPAAVVPAAAQTDTRVYGPKGEIIRPNAMAAPGEPPVSDLDVYKTSELDRYGGETTRKKNDSAPAQNTTPPPAKFNMSPTVWSYAINMGLIQNGKPVESAIRAFQKNNGLEVDGVIGNDTSNAIISAATTGMPNIGRGNQGGATPYQKTLPPMPAQKTATGPVSTGRQPWEHTPPEPEPVQTTTPVPAAINRGTNTKYKNPPDQGSTPAATKKPIYRGSESGKNYVNPDQPRGAHPTNMSYDKNGKALFPMPSPFADQNATAAPVAATATTKAAPAATAPARPEIPPVPDSAKLPLIDRLRAPFGYGPASSESYKDSLDAYVAADQAWLAKYGKTHNKDGTPKTVQATVVKESSDLARIRHLAGLTRN